MMVPAQADKEQLLALVHANPEVQSLLQGKTLVKEIAVPGRLVGLVVR